MLAVSLSVCWQNHSIIRGYRLYDLPNQNQISYCTIPLLIISHKKKYFTCFPKKVVRQLVHAALYLNINVLFLFKTSQFLLKVDKIKNENKLLIFVQVCCQRLPPPWLYLELWSHPSGKKNNNKKINFLKTEKVAVEGIVLAYLPLKFNVFLP